MTTRREDRRGLSVIELLGVMLIISILASVAQPQLSQVIVKAQAADLVSDMQTVRLAIYNYQADQQSWPAEVSSGQMPMGLETYLPEGFDFTAEDYSLDFQNWGGTPYMVGVAVVTSDAVLGATLMDMLSSPKWSVSNKYTWVVE